jgi:hypothetical protein
MLSNAHHGSTPLPGQALAYLPPLQRLATHKRLPRRASSRNLPILSGGGVAPAARPDETTSERIKQ